ncbi:biorientation of chromosomes in cell division protein 1-like 1 isoform X2 [Daktulosphaira vitifoliae]|uniref:biorientation of chromosomes in cell division protein 1-like 1 isoform X2 n=1 Tax=Daktulosphaira vitifoliae TaxID=58002 RepID=UPI0021AA49F3|nr:biorientation of chromosomes in cell division protein 1-like 1 isoform X2 [Daktulosphaira vitifoliae]
MNQKNDNMLSVDDTVFVLLESLKSNGTFDEFRRDCVSNIDAKPTYQNWKQRIETNISKFLSKVKYTPELNKNTIRERLRKHLFDGCESREIEDGADRILNQVLAPRTISVFESKIEYIVNEYLGIKNENTNQHEHNGFRGSSVNVNNLTEIKINVSNQDYDQTKTNDINESADVISPEFEPLISGLDENSNDESISGMSDLNSIGGSPVQTTNENSENNLNGFKFENISVDLIKNGVDPINESDKTDINRNTNNTEKPKTIDSSPKSKSNLFTSSKIQDKSHISSNKSEKSKENCSNSVEKNNSKKSKDLKDKKSSNHNKHRSENKDKERKHRHDKKSHHSDREKSPKRDRKDSRPDMKEKSSSLCKEPKSTNGNRSDDESNAGGSSKQKSNSHKNKCSTSEKSKSSSSHHKSSRKDNGNKDVVDKPNDNSSDISLAKHSKEAKNNDKKSKNNERVETKTIDQYTRSISTNKLNTENFLSAKIQTETKNSAENLNRMIKGNSSSNSKQEDDFLLESEKFNQINSINDVSQYIRSKNLDEICKSPINKDSASHTEVSDSTHQNIITDSRRNGEIGYKLNTLQNNLKETCKDKSVHKNKKSKEFKDKDKIINISKKNSNFTNKFSEFTEPLHDDLKLKLKRIGKDKYKRNSEVYDSTHASKTKKLKKASDILNDLDVPHYDSFEKNNEFKTKINFKIDKNLMNMYLENKNYDISEHDKSDLIKGFIGFNQMEAIPCQNYAKLNDIVTVLQDCANNITEKCGFKGFTSTDAIHCKNRDIVLTQLVDMKNDKFQGFSNEEVQVCFGHKQVKHHLEIIKNQISAPEKSIHNDVANGSNGTRNGKTLNNVMAFLYENDEISDSKTNIIYNQPTISSCKSDILPTTNNNNREEIKTSRHWVDEQEMKYKLLPVKVKLERLLECRTSDTKYLSDARQLPGASNVSEKKD